MPIAQRRLIAAAAVVTVLIAIVPISGFLVGDKSAADANAPAFVGIHAQALAQADDIEGMLNQLEDMARVEGEAPTPAWFQREIGVLPNARDVRTDGTSVVGFLVDGTSDEVLAALTSHMEGRGWIAVPLGEVEGATFVKQTGVCTWVLATCSQTGSVTSVVLRCNAD